MTARGCAPSGIVLGRKSVIVIERRQLSFAD